MLTSHFSFSFTCFIVGWLFAMPLVVEVCNLNEDHKSIAVVKEVAMCCDGDHHQAPEPNVPQDQEQHDQPIDLDFQVRMQVDSNLTLLVTDTPELTFLYEIEDLSEVVVFASDLPDIHGPPEDVHLSLQSTLLLI